MKPLGSWWFAHPNPQEPLNSYEFICHPWLGRRLSLRGKTYEVVGVLRRWRRGWYWEVEIEGSADQDELIRIPIENICSHDSETLERIRLSSELIVWEEDPKSKEE